MKISITVLLVSPFLFFSSLLSAQIIWSEDFESYAIGTGYVGSSTPISAVHSADYPDLVSKWAIDTASASLTSNTDWLSVRFDAGGNKVFEFRDTDGEFVWSSELIDISSYFDVVLSVSVIEVSSLESTDYINVYYILDGGDEILFETNGANSNDFTKLKAMHDSISGTSLQLVIRGKNNANSELIRFDDIVVSEKSLLITEVASPFGASSAAYIELMNCANHTIDFDSDTYYLSIQSNGVSWTDIKLEGSLCSGCVTLYAQSSDAFNTAYNFSPPNFDASVTGAGTESYFIYFNGNHSSGSLVDIYGELNVDGTGQSWEFSNSKAVRTVGSSVGLSTWDGLEWVISTANTSDVSPGALENEQRYYNSIWHPDATIPSSYSTNFDLFVQDGTAVLSQIVECSSLVVSPSATLIISPGIGVSVTGNCTNNGELTIESNATSNGSLIVNGACIGNVNYELYLVGDASSPWHLISSPTLNQSINDFVLNAVNEIPTSVNNNYGLAKFDSSTQLWNYFHNGLGASPNINVSSAGNFVQTAGYSVLRPSSGKVRFTGMVNTSDQSYSLIPSEWNLIGNPFPSFVSLNTSSNAFYNLINTNSMLTAPAYQALYVWDISVSEYRVINQSSPATYLAPGQAAFIFADSNGGEFTFTESMLSHQSGDWFERLASWSTIELVASTEQYSSTTEIKFIENQNLGLDPGFDAGRFTGGSEPFFVSTKFVDLSFPQLDLAIQCLPELNENGLYSIPLNVFATDEIELSFQLSSVNIPEGYTIYLIDDLFNTQTNLSSQGSIYTCLVNELTYNSARFSLSFQIEADVSIGEFPENSICIYSSPDRSKLNILGKLSPEFDIYVYDTFGKMVLSLNCVSTRQINLPVLLPGIYFVKIYSFGQSIVKKIQL